MKQLSRAAQSKAAAFLKNEGRSLEQKLYAYHFEGGALTGVLAALAHFQNPDGGFGHALEPDLRLPDSSVIATTVAFQRLREVRAPSDHPIVADGCRYLRSAYDAKRINWPIIPPNVDEAPHAPWWVYDGALSQSLSNPRAEILGYFYDYPDHFPGALREQVTDAVVDHLAAQPDEMEMHDLQCYVRLFETPSLPEKIRARLFEKLKSVVEKVVARDPAQWHTYGLPPLGVIASPDSPFAPGFRAELEANLDFLIGQQGEEGTWSPNWSWGDLWPDAWAHAKRGWQSVLTLNALTTLRAFNRLA
jgi:hypothetical protein